MNRIIVLMVYLLSVLLSLRFSMLVSTHLSVKLHVETSNAQKVVDEQHNTDFKYKRHLTIKILNGKFKGESTTIDNTYVKSQTDSRAL